MKHRTSIRRAFGNITGWIDWPPGVLLFVLIVLGILGPSLWLMIRRGNTHILLDCEIEYSHARTAADTAKVDDMTPITRANVRAKCGSMRRALERRDSAATARVPRD